jgi:hypothetical protein
MCQGPNGPSACNFNSIWVNAEGKRFTQEFGDPKIAFSALLRQPGATYWSVFDESGRRGFSVTLAGWENFNEVSKLVYGTEAVTLKADSIDELAIKMKVPKEGLRATIERHNHLTVEGVDHVLPGLWGQDDTQAKEDRNGAVLSGAVFSDHAEEHGRRECGSVMSSSRFESQTNPGALCCRRSDRLWRHQWQSRP